MSAAGVEHTDWEGEQPDIDRRSVTMSSRVVSVSTVFFFGGFLFAFVYLRIQNVNGRWNRGDVKPSIMLGGLILAASVIAVAALLGVHRSLRSDDLRRWRAGAVVALFLILAGIVLRIVQLWTLDVNPSSGGYASVMIGWSLALVLVEIGALYWIETLVARSGRIVRSETDSGATPSVDVAAADQRFLASADGFTLFWCVVAAIELLAYVLLDLVR
jgi:heme/copper-type cytochrome/quinol oxidase subunit 3